MDMKSFLEAHGQTRLMRFVETLNESQRKSLQAQFEKIDWSVLSALHVSNVERGTIRPIESLKLAQIEARREEFFQAGKTALKAGKLAAVMLAGGQGTRLGSSAPKGAYNVGLTRPLYIFGQLLENLKTVCNDCGVTVPLLIMTSGINDGATRTFFEEHNYFGYPKSHIRFFVQDMSPCIGENGDILLEEKDRFALSPNGNGGWYSSLVRAGLMKDELLGATEWFNVFSVDNVLQRIADPVFLGATVLSGKKCGAKVVRKACPEEKVGVLCMEDELPGVIEYYELPETLANLRDSEGGLVYSAGVTLNYLFHAKTLERVSHQSIPVHVVKKKIPFIDEKGKLVNPQTENGYKFETLILDLIKLMGSCLPYEVEREREFAPVKNLTGTDSVDTARELLKKNGVKL